VTLFWIISSLDGGWGEYWETSTLYARTTAWDARFEQGLRFTLWVAILAVPFQNLTAFGVDQLNAQRMFCCKDAKSASKALVWSSVGQLMTLMMLLVGAALVVHYDKNPFTAREGIVVMGIEENDREKALVAAQEALDAAPRLENPAVEAEKKAYLEANPDDKNALGFEHSMVSNVREVSKPDNVFPMWIVTQLPVGLSGLILAGVFAAAISSLDSILAALSQTTLSLMYNPEKKTDEELENLNLVTKSKILVICWGILLTLFTLGLVVVAQGIPVLPLAFGMTTYTMGPMLAIFLCSMVGKASIRGLIIGVVTSFIIAMFMRMDIWVLVEKMGADNSWLASLPTYAMNADGKIVTTIAFPWIWPLTTVITFTCGLLIPGKSKIKA